ncbi:MAG TPA: histidinol-phosphate transaminase [Steroidobacteraceae bacterium]
MSFNPNVAALPVYNAGLNVAVARSISGREDIARLGSNENPYGCSPSVMRALGTSALEPWRYADPACRALRTALSDRVGAAFEEIVIGNGSEELIAAISRAFLVPGATALTVVPSFGLHEIEPLATGAVVRKVPMNAALDFDVEALEHALADAPQIFFLPSPWNPVGPALDRASLERLARAAPSSTLFVLDEAYREFADQSAPDGIEVLRSVGIPHVSLRTFSKAWGLAGLRVGYAVCSDAEIARVITAAKTPFNVNAAAQLAAVAALEDEPWMHDTVARIRVERERVRLALTALGLRVAPSQGNFLFFDCGTASSKLSADLVKEGIIVKPWNEPGYEHYMRASIGLPQENDRLIAALAQQLGR